MIKMADVLLLPTKGRQSLNSIPSKLITYLLSGRPVIAAVLPESDTAAAILESGAGWVVNPDSAELMAEAILAASEQSAESLRRMGSAGREYALAKSFARVQSVQGCRDCGDGRQSCRIRIRRVLRSTMVSAVVKRAFDLAGGTLALALASPVLLLCAIAVWLDSGSPVIFTHDRLGLNGRIFKMLKFRSMYRNVADLRNPDGSTFNAQDDPRVTRIGTLAA